MSMEWAREKAAQAWCGERTRFKEMDGDLCEEFAKILDAETRKPLLGNATTRELIGEIAARIDVLGELDYKTTETDEEYRARKKM